MYTVQCPICSVHCTVYSVQSTVYSVQCTLYTVLCTIYIRKSIISVVLCHSVYIEDGGTIGNNGK